MKYREEVQQHATSPPTSSIPRSSADTGIADEETTRLIRCHSSVASCLLTLGEVRGILSATTVNSLVNFRAMTGTDFRLCSCLNHQEARRANPRDVDKSVLGMTSQGGSTWKQSVQRCTETPPVMAGELEKTALHESFHLHPKAKREFRWWLLEQHICRPTHYSRIHSGLTHAQDGLQVSPTDSWTIFQLCSSRSHTNTVYSYTSLSI